MISLPKNLETDIKTYCDANNITDIDKYIIDMITRGHNIEKYGYKPNDSVIEKVVEKIIEVPISVDNTELNQKIKELTDKVKELTEENNIVKDSLKKLNNKKDIYGE